MIKNGSATILSNTARLIGEMHSDDDIVLAGTFEGTLRTSRTLQITNTGTVEGEVMAESVLVLGRVSGPIHATDRIELQAGAVVNGDLNAQRVRIHDDVIFNGNCRISGPEAARRQYLVPAMLQVFGEGASKDALGSVERAAETFLNDFGFDVEIRPDKPVEGTLRPIFKSRDALPYSHLREKLRFVEHALQSATSPESPRRFGGLTRKKEEDSPLQSTGADGARALVEALGQLRNAALLVGPVIVTRFEEDRGARLTVRVRHDSLPTEGTAPGTPPDPSAVLVSLQKAQTEVMRDLNASASMREKSSRG